MVVMKGDAVADARIVFGGVAPFPLRATGAEAALKGKRIMDGMAAACEAAIKGAEPLSNNGYKVKATKGLLEKALSSLA
jgi:xanthine dehydrogenase YagS FAD-binding subunit